MSTVTSKPKNDAALCRTLAPEEIRAGQIVTLLYEIEELYPCVVCTLDSLDAPKVTHLKTWPAPQGAVLKVREVCLPLVMVKIPTGQEGVLDARRCTFAELPGATGAAMWSRLRDRAKKAAAKAAGEKANGKTRRKRKG